MKASRVTPSPLQNTLERSGSKGPALGGCGQRLPNLETIQAPVLAIDLADDERDPPETGTLTQSLKRIKNARLYLIPASAETLQIRRSRNSALRLWCRDSRCGLRLRLPQRMQQ